MRAHLCTVKVRAVSSGAIAKLSTAFARILPADARCCKGMTLLLPAAAAVLWGMRVRIAYRILDRSHDALRSRQQEALSMPDVHAHSPEHWYYTHGAVF